MLQPDLQESVENVDLLEKLLVEEAILDLLGLDVGDVSLEVDCRVDHLNQQRT